MIKKITKDDFRQEFKEMGRGEQFTLQALDALYDYLEEYEENTDDAPLELDVIALCCEYTEYEDLAELQLNYMNIKNMEDLENNTQVIKIPGTERFIIQNF